MIGSPILEGKYVRLRPLDLSDVDRLVEIGLDERIWHVNPDPVRTPEDMVRYVQKALAGQADGTFVPFSVEFGGQVVGCTRYGNIVPEHRRLEIGWTWIAPPWQGTVVNTEAKLLLFSHAFDTLSYNRVELKTDARNAQSRAAMRAIGCVEEGVLRHHMVLADGTVRDTVYFSVTRPEWPAVRDHLRARLERRASRKQA
jgi:RimJ/RimL family protein N-acetyltransferase